MTYAISNYLQNKLIDQMFRGQSFSFPTTLYFALYTAAPTAAGGGTQVSGGSYARVALACSTANFAATDADGSTASTSGGTSGATSNNVSIAFPTPTADWGIVTHIGIFDASTSGNLLFWGSLARSTRVLSGDSAPTIDATYMRYILDHA